ncbi:MAG: LysR family transcriptional regulator, partial [Variovorax sp.]
LTLGPIALTSDVLVRCEAQMHEGKVHFVLAHAHSRVPGSLDGEAYLSAAIGTDRLVPVSKATASGGALHCIGKKALKNGVPVLAYTEESGLGRVVRAVLGQRLEAMSAHAVFTAHLASVLRSMALDGRGIAWLPQSLVVDDLDAGRLVAAADADLCVDLEIRLYRPRLAVGRTTKEFWDVAVRSGPGATGRQWTDEDRT